MMAPLLVSHQVVGERRNGFKIIRMVVVRAMLVAVAFYSVGITAGVVHASASPGQLASTPIPPVSVTKTIGKPDVHGGYWVETVQTWKTSYPVTKPNAAGQVFQSGTASTSNVENTPYVVSGGGGCYSGYTTKSDGWTYYVGGVTSIAALWLDLDTQNYYNNCASPATVTSMYVDTRCGTNGGSFSCDTPPTQYVGVYHDVHCAASGTVGTCNEDWYNEKVTEWGTSGIWEYMRSWSDIYGGYGETNDVR